MNNRLTKTELEAVIGIGGDVDAPATVESMHDTPEEQQADLDAFERGMDKLRGQLARMERYRPRDKKASKPRN